MLRLNEEVWRRETEKETTSRQTAKGKFSIYSFLFRLDRIVAFPEMATLIISCFVAELLHFVIFFFTPKISLESSQTKGKSEMRLMGRERKEEKQKKERNGAQDTYQINYIGKEIVVLSW